jgi:primosomal protein N' (replication factor Y)
VLLHGVTGSGKTEVYLHAAETALAQGKQALVLVPEINLTPQLEARFAARFPGRVLVSLHSGLTPAQRLRHWLLAHLGVADLVLGTRLAVFAPLPRLGLIVVDEEHDPSFKQQEGARYSARDLAVWRGAPAEACPCCWARPRRRWKPGSGCRKGRYQRLPLAARIGGGAMPRVRLVDMGRCTRWKGTERVLAPALLSALQERIAGRTKPAAAQPPRLRAGAALQACGWKSGVRTAAPGVCSTSRPHAALPPLRPERACAARLPRLRQPGHRPMGRGTEKLQEQLAVLLLQARMGRIDADSTRGVGTLQQQLQAVHAGDVDVLVGTQMVAKGHDFRRVTLVAAVNPDTALFSSDFRAPERLFALLMQAAGRAGPRRRTGRAQRDVGADLAPPPPDLRGAVQARLRRLCRGPARRAPGRRPAALCRAGAAAGRCTHAPKRRRLPGRGQPRWRRPVAASPSTRRGAAARGQGGRRGTHADAGGVPSRSALQRMLAAGCPNCDGARAPQGLLRWAVDVDPLVI